MDLLTDYFPILIFLVIALSLAIIILVIPNILATKNPSEEKNSAYECGFEAFGQARGEFDVRFYLVAILFIIFDLEIAFLFPWAVAMFSTSLTFFTGFL